MSYLCYHTYNKNPLQFRESETAAESGIYPAAWQRCRIDASLPAAGFLT